MTIMHSDSYFCIGSTHNVCQDYATHGKTSQNKAYALVADGCSGSPHTDFGSRFMVKSMEFMLDTHAIDDFIFLVVSAHAAQMASSCNLGRVDCNDATLLCALEHEQEGRSGVLAWAAGDGTIVARHRGRSYFDVHNVEFYAGFPAYASYQDDIGRLQEYFKHTDGGEASIQVTNGEDGIVQKFAHKFYPDLNSKGAVYQPYKVFFDAEKYDLVAVLSDGVSSFHEKSLSETSKHQTALIPEVILNEVMDFKNLKGEFVIRRVKRFLSKTCVDNRWVHHDDFSMACVSVEVNCD